MGDGAGWRKLPDKKGHFSRRNQTPGAHFEHRENFRTLRSSGARRERAMERTEAAAQRTPQEQLARLESRGHGHCAEAQRLIGELLAEKLKEGAKN